MEDQGKKASPTWPQGLLRIAAFGSANVILKGVFHARPVPDSNFARTFAIPAKPEPIPVKWPVLKKFKEPDLLDELYMIYGILRPPRH
jgi:hypothetical protein